MLTLILVILAAVIFEYSNGFHDAANAIATVVSTRVLTPRQAIAMGWTVVERIVWAWVFTLPATALIGYMLERAIGTR